MMRVTAARHQLPEWQALELKVAFDKVQAACIAQ